MGIKENFIVGKQKNKRFVPWQMSLVVDLCLILCKKKKEAVWKYELRVFQIQAGGKIDLNYAEPRFNDRGEEWTWSFEWTNTQSATASLNSAPLNQRGRQFSSPLTTQEGPSWHPTYSALCHLTHQQVHTLPHRSVLSLMPYLLLCAFSLPSPCHRQKGNLPLMSGIP